MSIPILPPALPWANVETPKVETLRQPAEEEESEEEETPSISLEQAGLQLGSRVEVASSRILRALLILMHPAP